MTLEKNGSSEIHMIPQVANSGRGYYRVTFRDQISRPISYFLISSPPISGCTRYEGNWAYLSTQKVVVNSPNPV